MNDSIEPQRLLDDPNVIGSLRGDLSAATNAAPLRYDIEAGLARFQAQLTQVSSATGAASVSAAGGSSLAVGKVVAGVAGLLLVGGAAWALLAGGPEPTPPPSTTTAPAVAVVAQTEEGPVSSPASPAREDAAPAAPVAVGPGPIEAAELVEQAEPAEPIQRPEPAAEPVAADEPPRPAARTKRSQPADDGAGSDILREAKKVQQAKKALGSNPGRTLRLLREVEREFPNGQLTEEREGLYVLALLGLGKTDEGKRRADAYLAHHPRGTLATRVRRALGQLP